MQHGGKLEGRLADTNHWRQPLPACRNPTPTLVLRARHLTIHGSNKNEDGTYSWKFDNYTHTGMISNFSYEDMIQIWTSVTCPVLLINATEGFEHRIGHDGSHAYFPNHTIETIPDAGHWLHHDQFARCLELISAFLKQHA